jgi:hypothetical protein
MKIEIPYVEKIQIDNINEIKTKNGKIFYQNKIIIKSSTEILTLILNSMQESMLFLNTKKTENPTFEKHKTSKSKKQK